MDVKTLIDRAANAAGSRAALARALNVPAPNVTQWASGARQCPDEKIVRMAQIAGLNPEAVWHRIGWARLGKLVQTSLAGAVGIICTLAALAGHAPHAAAATGDNV